MVEEEVLLALLPSDPPDRQPEYLSDAPLRPGARRLSAWAASLRARLREQAAEDLGLAGLIESSGFIGTGIFRTGEYERGFGDPAFPRVGGWQFGAVLLRGQVIDADERVPHRVRTEAGFVPLVQLDARPEFLAHRGEGRIAAYFSEDGIVCGLTARHVVDHLRPGQRAEVDCPHGQPTRLRRLAVGLIDAAVVETGCGDVLGPPSPTRCVAEGDRLLLHFDDGRPTATTAVTSLQTPAQFKTAAIPRHFLTDGYGRPGDSGSLVSAVCDGSLTGIFLGSTVCEDEHGVSATYGYALDIDQAATIVGATALSER